MTAKPSVMEPKIVMPRGMTTTATVAPTMAPIVAIKVNDALSASGSMTLAIALVAAASMNPPMSPAMITVIHMAEAAGAIVGTTSAPSISAVSEGMPPVAMMYVAEATAIIIPATAPMSKDVV